MGPGRVGLGAVSKDWQMRLEVGGARLCRDLCSTLNTDVMLRRIRTVKEQGDVIGWEDSGYSVEKSVFGGLWFLC